MFNSRHPDSRRVWRWGPSSGSRHHFRRIRCKIIGVSILLLFIVVLTHVRVKCNPICSKTQKTPQGSPRPPNGFQRDPKGRPKAAQRRSRAPQRNPSVTQGTQREPKTPKVDPRETLFNSRHPDPWRVWRWGPSSGS